MEKDKINPLKFVFNLGGTFYHKFDREKEFKEIKKYESVIIGGSNNDMHSFKIPGNKQIKVLSLELNRNLFEHKTAKFNLTDDLKVLFNDVNALNPFFYSYNFGSAEFEMIKKITETEKEGFVGSLFKEGLTYSLLSYSFSSSSHPSSSSHY